MIVFNNYQFPPEIFFSICQFLDIRDVFNLKQVSKMFHQTIAKNAFNIFPEQAYRKFAADIISNMFIDTSDDNVNRITSYFLQIFQRGYMKMNVMLSEEDIKRTAVIDALKKHLNSNFKPVVSAKLSENLELERLIMLIQSIAETGLGKTYRLGLGEMYTGKYGIIEFLNKEWDFPSYKEPFLQIRQFLASADQHCSLLTCLLSHRTTQITSQERE